MTIDRSAIWGEGAWWERCYSCFSVMSFGHWRNQLHVTTEPPRAASTPITSTPRHRFMNRLSEAAIRGFVGNFGFYYDQNCRQIIRRRAS